MHGRLKVRTTEEQKAIKHKEQQKKLAGYRMGMKQILASRNAETYDSSSFNLSAQLLSVNPDIYTLWNYRKEVVLIETKDLSKDGSEGETKLVNFLDSELGLTEHCLISNPKSYGSWHHRYWILEHNPKPNWQREFDLCNKYLSKDDRNFHCWDYRRLIVNKIGITVAEEIKFSTERININFSNYSSWHYRSTILKKLDQDTASTELTLVQNAVFTDPLDTSAWFYLRWVLTNPGVDKERRQELVDALEQLEELEPDCKWIVMAKCWLIATSSALNMDFNAKKFQFLKELIKLDSMRRGYYEDSLKTTTG